MEIPAFTLLSIGMTLIAGVYPVSTGSGDGRAAGWAGGGRCGGGGGLPLRVAPPRTRHHRAGHILMRTGSQGHKVTITQILLM